MVKRDTKVCPHSRCLSEDHKLRAVVRRTGDTDLLGLPARQDLLPGGAAQGGGGWGGGV